MSSNSFIDHIFKIINPDFSLSNFDNEEYDLNEKNNLDSLSFLFNYNYNFDNDLISLNFFFDIINILLSDSISLVNVLNSTKSIKMSDKNLENSGYPLNELEFILANLYLIDASFKSATIKKVITKFKNKEIDLAIERISTSNKNSHSYELKETFKNCFDLSLFSETSDFYQQMYETIKNLSKNKFSVIIGNRETTFYENSIFLKTIKTFMQENFLSFFFNIIENKKLEETLEKFGIFGKLLKTLYIFLQTQTHEKTSNKTFFENLEKFNCRKRLDELSIIHENNSDYLIALKKIIELFDQRVQNKEKFYLIIPEPTIKTSADSIKKKIFEEFNKKRQNFIDKFEEKVPENSSLLESPFFSDELSLCSFCLQNKNVEKDDIMGFITFISIDNISKSLINDKFFQEKTNFSIIPCNHTIHIECHKGEMKGKQKKSNMNFSCNYCKRLSNLVVPMVDTLIFSIEIELSKFFSTSKKKEEIKEIQKEIKMIKLCDLDLKNQRVFEDFYSEIYCACSSFCSEDSNFSVREVLMKVLMDFFEKIYYGDFLAFFGNDMSFIKSIFHLSLFNFLTSEIENQKQIKIEIEILIDQNITNIAENVAKSFSFNFENLHRNFLRVLLYIRYTMNGEDAFFLSQLKYIIEVFVSNILILCYFLYNSEDVKLTFEKLHDFFLEKDIQSKTITFLTPFYSLIIGFLITCFKTDSKLQSLIDSLLKTKDFENSELLKEFTDILNPEPSILKERIEKWGNLFNNLNSQEKADLKKGLCQISKNPYNLSISQIKNYDDLLLQNIWKKCSVCKFYPKKCGQKLYLCLICNILTCNGSCNSKEIHNLIGNMTNHAKICHESQTIFMNISDGSFLIIALPNIILEQSVFVDNHGQLMKDIGPECKKSYAQYQVNDKKMNKWVSSLLRSKLNQDIFNEISLEPKKLIKNPNWKNI